MKMSMHEALSIAKRGSHMAPSQEAYLRSFRILSAMVEELEARDAYLLGMEGKWSDVERLERKRRQMERGEEQ